MNKNYIPTLCVLLGASMWGFIGIFVNRLPNTTAFELLAVRSLVSAIGLLICIFIKDKELFKINIRDIWLFLGTGVVSFGAYTVFYTNAIRLTSMSTAVVLLYTSPVFVTVMAALFFKEKLNLTKIIAVVGAFCGCVLICGFSRAGALGIVSGLMSGFCYALYSIFGAVAVKKYHSLTVTFYTFVFAFLFSVPFVNWQGFIMYSGDTSAVFWFLMYAVFCGLLPYLLYTYGLSKMPSSNAAVMACVEPVVATVLGTVVVGEEISLFQIAGILLVLGAVFILQIKK